MDDVTGWGFRPADECTSLMGLSFQTSPEAARSGQVGRRIRLNAGLHRASGAPEAAVTCQECPSHGAEGRGDAILQSVENIWAKVVRRIAPSHSSRSLVSAVFGLSDVIEVIFLILLLIRKSKWSPLEARLPFPFWSVAVKFSYLSVRSCSTQNKTSPNTP